MLCSSGVHRSSSPRGSFGSSHAISATVRHFVLVHSKRNSHLFLDRGVAFALALKGRALIGDEMGLGKTVQVVSPVFVGASVPLIP